VRGLRAECSLGGMLGVLTVLLKHGGLGSSAFMGFECWVQVGDEAQPGPAAARAARTYRAAARFFECGWLEPR
jgi:hypothetical protein